jgi:hypothetical protein
MRIGSLHGYQYVLVEFCGDSDILAAAMAAALGSLCMRASTLVRKAGYAHTVITTTVQGASSLFSYYCTIWYSVHIKFDLILETSLL